ncbi:MAG: DUF2760 domain-containing protein [Acidobacteriota bacterium]|nr:DUF2760 domain-containing protein [Acidobacteriota bacterium]
MIGIGKRISYAFRCFFSVVSNGEVPEDIAHEVTPDASKTSATLSATDRPQSAIGAATPRAIEDQAAENRVTMDSTDRAVQMLALLQRDGRLIDFLSEDITAYQDAQIGAAVRELHINCRKALDQYVKMEPIIAGEEDSSVTVDAGFNPASIKLIGNVTGKPPMRGLLRHHGWRVTEVKLPPLSAHEAGRSVVAPAEVEIP